MKPKLEKLESQKALITENLANKPDPKKGFDQSFRTALAFLANPWNLWTSNNPEHRKTLIKLVFAAPLPYMRNQGFRTVKTTSPFKALASISEEEKEMAERVGFEPTVRLHARRFSRPVQSTTLPPLQIRVADRPFAAICWQLQAFAAKTPATVEKAVRRVYFARQSRWKASLASSLNRSLISYRNC